MWHIADVFEPTSMIFITAGGDIQHRLANLALLWFVLHRITRLLDALAQSTWRFSETGAPETLLQLSGLEDISRLVAVHNAMQARIGRSDVAAERTELGALAASVVEEFEDMDEPVTMEQQVRILAPVHITWVKRGLRNLIINALRYGGSAEITVLREGGWAVLRADDQDSGMLEDHPSEMLELFTCGEANRNHDTGGAGLGLALARAVAEQHGGTLVLANRPQSGLRAYFCLSTG